jgi:predicted acetyltransferase
LVSLFGGVPQAGTRLVVTTALLKSWSVQVNQLLELVEPTADLADSYRGLVEEFLSRDEPLQPFPLSFPYDDFQGMLDRLAAYSAGDDLPPHFVPHSTFWLVRDGVEVVGVSNLRHSLTEKLRREGGHIGYGVRPSARRLGYATEMLRQTLTVAVGLGLTRVLLTCSSDNEGSVRTIENNGGQLESEEFIPERGEMIRRYWITLESPG